MVSDDPNRGLNEVRPPCCVFRLPDSDTRYPLPYHGRLCWNEPVRLVPLLEMSVTP